ncbi:hypothetical protein ACHFJ0_08995 [Paracoccus sp. NGMCC 1.201697]|uniref:Uncharacterized protein n=1 Tax=Paracoccus broussonetiae subsp. drimophilus TaxID=3373869 RepID=A0ABW7LM49_9RHOB
MHQIVLDALRSLAPKRPIFHSEADFKIALAIEIGLAHPGINVRAETVLVEDANSCCGNRAGLMRSS